MTRRRSGIRTLATKMWAIHWMALALSAAGCDSCKGLTKRPDEPTVTRVVREKLAHAEELASKLCGVPASGLSEIELVIENGALPGFSTVKVRGKLLPPTNETTSSSSSSSGSGSTSPLDLVRPAICTGVLTAFLVSRGDGDHDAESWALQSLTVDEVTTPGHEWKETSSHHHHHG